LNFISRFFMCTKGIKNILPAAILLIFSSIGFCQDFNGFNTWKVSLPVQILSGTTKHEWGKSINIPLASITNQVRQNNPGVFSSVANYPGIPQADEGSKQILGMYIQVSMGKLRYNYEEKSLYTFDQEYTKGGGVSLEIPLISLSERFSVFNELGFSQFKATTERHYSDTTGGDPEHNYYDIFMVFSPNMLTISNTMRYVLTPGDFRYFVALGIYNSFVVSSTNTKETIHTLKGKQDKYTENAVPDPAIHGLMLLASTGFTYRNIGLELRFDPGRNYTNKLNYAVYMPAFSALLHVRFTQR